MSYGSDLTKRKFYASVTICMDMVGEQPTDDLSERNRQTVTCGCGNYEIHISETKHIRSLDIICPECKNHFGWDIPEEEFRGSRGTQRECDWCEAAAEHNKDIYYACDEHESELSELVEL